MNNRDYLLKIMDEGQNIRIFLANTTNLVEEAHQRHNTSATASAALGRVLTAAVMMGSDLKGQEDILTLRINGNGPAGTVLATADSQGGVRGLISEPQADLPSHEGKLAVGELIDQEGFLEVIKDLGLKQPFEGKVPLHSGEIAEDLAHYYMLSEQIPALVSLGVLVAPDLHIKAAGGLIVQALPGAKDEILAQVEGNILQLGNISQLINEASDLEHLAKQIMQGISYTVLAQQELDFRCSCSREKLGAILSTLGEEELKDAVDKDETIEVVCNFCKEAYHFSPGEIKALEVQKP